jgi:hypothetical protein
MKKKGKKKHNDAKTTFQLFNVIIGKKNPEK